MQALSIPFVDLTETVERIPAAVRYSGTHYSPLANAAVADALAPIVRARLDASNQVISITNSPDEE